MSWFYISFASETMGHLGSTVVEAKDEATALAVATMRGLNPGGEAMIVPVKTAVENTKWMRYRLVSKKEMALHGPLQTGRQARAAYVCELCNTGVPHTHGSVPSVPPTPTRH